MANFLTDMAAKVGVSREQIENGMGAVLNLLKEKLPEDTFAKVQSAVPGGDKMMAASADAKAALEHSDKVPGSAPPAPRVSITSCMTALHMRCSERFIYVKEGRLRRE